MEMEPKVAVHRYCQSSYCSISVFLPDKFQSQKQHQFGRPREKLRTAIACSLLAYGNQAD
jgi:hypothetical protein